MSATGYFSRTEASEARWKEEQAEIRAREESARKAYLDEIARRGRLLSAGKSMGPRHKLASLRVAYHKAKLALERLDQSLTRRAS